MSSKNREKELQKLKYDTKHKDTLTIPETSKNEAERLILEISYWFEQTFFYEYINKCRHIGKHNKSRATVCNFKEVFLETNH